MGPDWKTQIIQIMGKYETAAPSSSHRRDLLLLELCGLVVHLIGEPDNGGSDKQGSTVVTI